MNHPPDWFRPSLTTAQVAEMLDRSERMIRYHAVRYTIGTVYGPRVRLFSPADVDELRTHTNRKGRLPGPQEPGTRKKVTE